MEVFNICSADRSIREVVPAEPTIMGLKKAAFTVVQKPILALTMEATGCRVSNDLVLKFIRNGDVIMVLSTNEVWTPAATAGTVPQDQQTKSLVLKSDDKPCVGLVDSMVTDEEVDPAQTSADRPCEEPVDDMVTDEEVDASRKSEADPCEELVDVIVPDDDGDQASNGENASIEKTSPTKPERQTVVNTDVGRQTTESQAISSDIIPLTDSNNDKTNQPPASDQLDSPKSPLAKTCSSVNSQLVKVLQPVPTTSNKSLNPAVVQQAKTPTDTPTKSPKRSQPQLVKVSAKKVNTTMKFESYEINWAKLDDGVYARLKELDSARKQNPKQLRAVSKPDRLKVVNMIIDQLRQIDSQVSACVIEVAAKRVVEKFICFQPIDDDGFLDQNRGWQTLKTYMVNRNSFLNRSIDAEQKPSTSKETTHTRNVHAGTLASYWTEKNPTCESSIRSKLKRDDTNVLTDDILASSAGFMRYIIEQKKPLCDTLKEWPVIRRRKVIDYHFQKATGVNVNDLTTYYNAKRSKIIHYSQQKKKFTKLDDDSNDYDVFTFICNCLGENIEDICVKEELGTQLDQISLCPGPGLVAVDLGSSQSVYYVFAESARLTEGTSTFLIALQDLFGVMYVHNFMYPKKNSKFLEFVQQYLLKIIPSYGSKSKATRVGKQQRLVNQIINDLSSFSNDAEQ